MSRKKPDLLTQQARLRRKHREKGQVLAIFRKPMRESLTSVLPITAIVLLLCFTVTPVSNNAMMAFLVGSLLLIVGMGLFSLGSEMSMIPLGEAVGKEITRSKKVWIIVAISFLIGVIITVAEPDLQVLASQVPAIETTSSSGPWPWAWACSWSSLCCVSCWAFPCPICSSGFMQWCSPWPCSCPRTSGPSPSTPAASPRVP